MSIGRAIIDTWESSSLKTLVTGGLHWDEAPTSTEWPYQTFSIIAEPRYDRTSSSIRSQPVFEIQTFVKMVVGEYPADIRDQIQDMTEALFDDLTLTVANRSSMLIVQTNRFSFKEDTEIFRGVNEFNFTLTKSR